MKNLFRAKVDHYKSYAHIYTGASKSKRETGCAIVCPDKNDAYNIPDSTSISDSEAFAILEALRYIKDANLNKAIILSDSNSVVASIELKSQNGVLIRNILELYYEIKTANELTEVILVWITSDLVTE